MIKANFLFSILLFAAISAKSQTTDAIVGKWKFQDIYNAETMDTARLNGLRNLFADWAFYMKANKHYKSFFMNMTEEGSWTYDSSSKILTMIANKGTYNQREIISVTDQTLIISIGKDKSLILQKTTIDSTDDAEETIKNVDLVSATALQVCKKWYLIKRDVPNRTEEQSKMVTDLVSGAFFEFRINNSYESQVFKIIAEGSWQFGQDNKSLILLDENIRTFWKIKSVSENELVLIRGNTEEVWTFSTEH